MSRRAARPIRRSRTRRLVSRGRLARAGQPRRASPASILTLASAAAIGWLVTDHQFALAADGGRDQRRPLHRRRRRHRRARTCLRPARSNVFGLHTDPMRRALLALPAVAAADVHVALPDQLVVAITERTAVAAGHPRRATYLFDGDGIVLDARHGERPTRSPTCR